MEKRLHMGSKYVNFWLCQFLCDHALFLQVVWLSSLHLGQRPNSHLIKFRLGTNYRHADLRTSAFLVLH